MVQEILRHFRVSFGARKMERCLPTNLYSVRVRKCEHGKAGRPTFHIWICMELQQTLYNTNIAFPRCPVKRSPTALVYMPKINAKSTQARTSTGEAYHSRCWDPPHVLAKSEQPPCLPRHRHKAPTQQTIHLQPTPPSIPTPPSKIFSDLPFKLGSAPHASSRLTRSASPLAAAQARGKAYQPQLPPEVGLVGCI